MTDIIANPLGRDRARKATHTVFLALQVQLLNQVGLDRIWEGLYNLADVYIPHLQHLILTILDEVCRDGSRSSPLSVLCSLDYSHRQILIAIFPEIGPKLGRKRS